MGLYYEFGCIFKNTYVCYTLPSSTKGLKYLALGIEFRYLKQAC